MTTRQMACPHCSGPLIIAPEMQGREVQCPHCGQLARVPIFPASDTGSKPLAPPDVVIGSGSGKPDPRGLASKRMRRRKWAKEYMGLATIMWLVGGLALGTLVGVARFATFKSADSPFEVFANRMTDKPSDHLELLLRVAIDVLQGPWYALPVYVPCMIGLAVAWFTAQDD